MDIVEQMRSFEFDHEPDGWPAIQMKQVSALCDEIERLRAVIDAANAQEPLAKSYKNSSTGTGVEFLVINEMPEGETELYAHPIPAQQSPAVAVPDDWNAQCTCGHRWHAVMPTENCPSCNPSPRITEHDARELLNSAMLHFHPSQSYELRIEVWLDYQGRALLAKLNEKKHD